MAETVLTSQRGKRKEKYEDEMGVASCELEEKKRKKKKKSRDIEAAP